MATPGLFTDNTLDLADKTFYGFKLDPQTGNLEVHVIDDNTMTINLPEDNDTINDPNDYRHYVWSSNLLKFDFNESNGHLHLEIV